MDKEIEEDIEAIMEALDPKNQVEFVPRFELTSKEDQVDAKGAFFPSIR